MKKLAGLFALLAIVIAGCSAPADSSPVLQSQGPRATSTASVAVSSPTEVPTPVPTKPAMSAIDQANALKAKISTITKTVEITEDNDPNNFIGRPNQYTQAATVYDSNASCTNLGADCGATIEVWPTEAAAIARMNYIQEALKSANGMLGTEWNYVAGNELLRVSGELKPTQAKAYEEAWIQIAGS